MCPCHLLQSEDRVVMTAGKMGARQRAQRLDAMRQHQDVTKEKHLPHQVLDQLCQVVWCGYTVAKVVNQTGHL